MSSRYVELPNRAVLLQREDRVMVTRPSLLAPRPGMEACPRLYPRTYAPTICPRTTRTSEGAYGSRTTPHSVTIPVISRAGVTSNAGFATRAPSGATRVPAKDVTSFGSRSSITICSPDGVERSTVEVGGHAPVRESQPRRCRFCSLRLRSRPPDPHPPWPCRSVPEP
jgi:hypothetical protein